MGPWASLTVPLFPLPLGDLINGYQCSWMVPPIHSTAVSCETDEALPSASTSSLTTPYPQGGVIMPNRLTWPMFLNGTRVLPISSSS